VGRGATAVRGGQAQDGEFYSPTMHESDANKDAEIVRDEVFGPVLVVLTFDSTDQGLDIGQ